MAAPDLAPLTAQVEATKTVEASAILLITTMAAKIEASKNDPVALQALADSLKGSATDLGNAVAANTPAAP